ncbi:MAG: phosphate ABC transporter permease PstA [Rugosibacter sp.]|nr:MAG: phosphate ABC transporter permease PstA [Rugosibacter sp.]
MSDRAFTHAIWGAALLVACTFFWLLGDLIWRGVPHLSWQFFISAPSNAGRAGGIAPILVSTLLILAVAMAAAIPLGLGAAVWLAEYAQHKVALGRAVRLSLDVLAGVPSIVFGLFGNAFFSMFLGLGFSILSGGLTLACMILPIFIRTSEAGLSSIGADWRQSAAALGMTRATALWHILLRAAAPSIVAGFILGMGRATAETAALIFTSGYVDRMPGSLSDSGRSLAVHIYDLSMNVTGGDAAAYASALVLVLLIVAINSSAFALSDRWMTRRITLS